MYFIISLKIWNIETNLIVALACLMLKQTDFKSEYMHHETNKQMPHQYAYAVNVISEL